MVKNVLALCVGSLKCERFFVLCDGLGCDDIILFGCIHPFLPRLSM